MSMLNLARSRARVDGDIEMYTGALMPLPTANHTRTLGSCLLIRCWDAIRGVTFLVKSGPRPPDDAPPGRGVLPPELLVEMRPPAARMLGADIWGLGMQLYGRSGPSDHVFGHDGIKYPAINH